MLGTGHFLNMAKINYQQEKPFCPNRKISSRTQKHRQSVKISCHTVKACQQTLSFSACLLLLLDQEEKRRLYS